jgi:hypothetical protein
VSNRPFALLKILDDLDFDESLFLLLMAIRICADETGRCEGVRIVASYFCHGREPAAAVLGKLVERGYLRLFMSDSDYGPRTDAQLLKCKPDGDVEFGRIPWSEWKEIRVQIFRRDDFTCVYCSTRKELTQLEVDHLVPIAKGGTNEFGNLVTACSDCNSQKRARLLKDWRRLRVREDA